MQLQPTNVHHASLKSTLVKISKPPMAYWRQWWCKPSRASSVIHVHEHEDGPVSIPCCRPHFLGSTVMVLPPCNDNDNEYGDACSCYSTSAPVAMSTETVIGIWLCIRLDNSSEYWTLGGLSRNRTTLHYLNHPFHNTPIVGMNAPPLP